MPPPRPRGIGCSTGIAPARPNPNTPMSERQQMALLIQMTASSDNCRSTQKPKEYKKDEDFEDSHNVEKIDVKEKSDEVTDTKKDACFDALLADSTNNSIKRNLSDVDEDELDDMDDTKKKKRKESDIAKDFKQTSALRVPNRVDKTFKQATISKTAVSGTSKINTSPLSDKDETKCKSHDADIDDDDSKSDPLCSGGLKVPPLKIVIPQQSCTIDTDGNGTRTGKINTSRIAALPYVVSSNSDSNERDISIPNTSPRDSPVKINHTCGIVDEKSCKLLNEEKNLRVLRSAHRIGLTAQDRNSNNSSPQIPSNSPSPASSTTTDLIDGKIAFHNVNSPPHQNTSFEQDNILNLPSPSTSSTSSTKDTVGNNVELHPRKRKIKPKNDDVKSIPGHNSNNDTILCSDSHPHDIPFTNCFQMYMTIRKQIEKKWKNVVSVKPRPPQGFNEFLINTKKYLLHPKQSKRYPDVPNSMSSKMREFFLIQQKERFDLYQRHIVEKEKLCLNVEQEIIRIHSKAARSMSCQSLALSVCTYIKEEEVYNMLTPEQDDKDKNARYRFNGRLLLSWLQDVDDKWEKIKESMVLRHHNEAESLHAVQLMDWETALKKNELCDLNSQLIVENDHVPIVHVSDDFDLLPA